MSKLARGAGVRHSKIRDVGKRGCYSGPQPSDAACLQGRPQALGRLRGAAARDEPWEGDKLCQAPWARACAAAPGAEPPGGLARVAGRQPRFVL